MAITIGSNISALRAQRRMSEATAAFSTAMERLSSGMRINRAADDAAGLSISSTLRANSRLYQTAGRNINDGLSMLNITDSAIEQQSLIIQRLQEIAEQSANGTFSNQQRRALQKEYSELVKEFGRIGSTTSFNGIYTLNGTIGNAWKGDPAQGDLAIHAGITGASNSLLSMVTPTTSSFSGTILAADINGNGSYDGADPTALTSAFGSGPITDQALNSLFQGSLMMQTVTTSTAAQLEIAVGVYWDSVGFLDADDNFVGIPAIAVMYKNTQGKWQLTSVTKQNLSYDITKQRYTASPSVTSNFTAGSFGNGSVTLDLSNLKIADKFSNPTQQSSSLEFSSVDSSVRALDALNKLAIRAAELQTARADIGSYQSRLLTALNVINSSRENTDSAESRIRDADIAAETAKATAAQIRQQISAQVLSRATLQPQIALTLLQV